MCVLEHVSIDCCAVEGGLRIKHISAVCLSLKIYTCTSVHALFLYYLQKPQSCDLKLTIFSVLLEDSLS